MNQMSVIWTIKEPCVFVFFFNFDSQQHYKIEFQTNFADKIQISGIIMNILSTNLGLGLDRLFFARSLKNSNVNIFFIPYFLVIMHTNANKWKM